MSLMQKYTSVFRLVPNHSSVSLTTSFKNSGRNNDKHAFGARYTRPMHDLDYGKPILQHSSSKKLSKQLSKSNSKSGIKKSEQPEFRIKNMMTKSQTKFIEGNPANGVKPANYFIKSTNPETIQVQTKPDLYKTSSFFNKSSPSLKAVNKLKPSTFGLSDCQFGNTIVGKIVRRSSHHINFQKSPHRPQNVNKIWYDKDEVYSPVDREQNKNIKHKIHYFKSGGGHDVFKVTNTFDKFYDAPVQIVKRRTDAVIRELDKVKSRPALEIKLGTNLEYEKNRSLQNKRRPIFQISQTERELVISRQVISPKKGAYR